MTNTISILGSTGSIGRQTLDVAEQLGLRATALTANSNVERMEAQCRKFRPKLAVMTDENAAKDLAVRLKDVPVRVLAGTDALLEAAALPEADTVVTAVVGMVGLINYPRRHDPTRVQLGFHTLHFAFQPGACTPLGSGSDFFGRTIRPDARTHARHAGPPRPDSLPHASGRRCRGPPDPG